jgi:hypothetical protein
MNKPQYFLLMTDDHRQPKNKLHEQIRENVRGTFSQTLAADKEEVCRGVQLIIDTCNGLHRRSEPVKGHFSERDHFPGASDCFYVDGLFQLVFYKVKGVPNG